MKLKIYRAIFIILLLGAIILIALIAVKQWKSMKNEKENQEVVETFSNIQTTETENDETIQLKGYDVIGIVTIPKINIQYPILAIETSNPEETKEPMRYGIVKYWGGNVNDYGNLSIAGHNNYNGTMFGKTKNLEIGDIVELTDLTKTTMQYEIYDIFITDPNDIRILATNDETIREVTLITCTNGNRERLILKAKQIN